MALTGQGGDPHDHPPAVMGVVRAARQAAIDAAVKQAHTTDVYLIHSSPGQQRMAQYRAQGAKVVTIDPGKDVVRERCKTQRPRRMFAVIDEWYREQGAPSQPTQRVTATPAHSFPDVGSTTTREW